MKKLNLALALAAGFVGGAVSHYLAAVPVRADAPPPTPAEIRARSFLLVNEQGSVLGKFIVDRTGRPSIRLFDPSGREVWSAEGPSIRTAVGR
ncbi:MAG TPA: hypothetical protein VEG63_03310 [Candidatus Acidoferrales bacterium]|nr:hypothetical protein [Candidatus Acidoferrales bacterium]